MNNQLDYNLSANNSLRKKTTNMKSNKNSTRLPQKKYSKVVIDDKESQEYDIKKEEDRLKNELDEIKKLLNDLYQETNTEDINELKQYYTSMKENNQNNFNETKQLIE